MSASTGCTASEFSVATDDVEMEEQFSDVQLPYSNNLSKLEDQLYQYLFTHLSKEEETEINKFILVPIGLPGVGKSTLSDFLSATT